ncbi:hypothetical protein SDJN02_00453, partial [Cucurbita argyrosperma subsp. argyrosperma]
MSPSFVNFGTRQKMLVVIDNQDRMMKVIAIYLTLRLMSFGPFSSSQLPLHLVPDDQLFRYAPSFSAVVYKGNKMYEKHKRLEFLPGKSPVVSSCYLLPEVMMEQTEGKIIYIILLNTCTSNNLLSTGFLHVYQMCNLAALCAPISNAGLLSHHSKRFGIDSYERIDGVLFIPKSKLPLNKLTPENKFLDKDKTADSLSDTAFLEEVVNDLVLLISQNARSTDEFDSHVILKSSTD